LIVHAASNILVISFELFGALKRLIEVSFLLSSTVFLDVLAFLVSLEVV